MKGSSCSLSRRLDILPKATYKFSAVLVTGQQRDANENHNEIPLLTHQNGHHKQTNKCWLARLWREGNPSALSVRMWTGTATVEKYMEFAQETKNGNAF